MLEREKEFYNIEFAKKLTGIDDETILKFYIDSVISKIERIIGYKLIKSEKRENISGLDRNIIYLTAKPVESVSKAFINNKEVSFILDKHRLIFDFVICSCEKVTVEYIAGYEELPPDILMFICSTISETTANSAGLKSFSIKDVSYSYFDKVQQSENFRRGIIDIFGVSI